ncbi:iron chelate uptake ABC transporter family permease subunit [Spirillospora sp. CA-255316]
MVPHAVRLVVGGNNRRVLPLAALTGAILLVGWTAAPACSTSPTRSPSE